MDKKKRKKNNNKKKLKRKRKKRKKEKTKPIYYKENYCLFFIGWKNGKLFKRIIWVSSISKSKEYWWKREGWKNKRFYKKNKEIRK